MQYETPDCGIKGPYFLCNYQGCVSNIKWLYSAKMDGKDVCVKFVPRQYGIEVHQFLAENNLAPKLLQTAHLPGGWIVIVMVNREMLEKFVNSPQVKECLR